MNEASIDARPNRAARISRRRATRLLAGVLLGGGAWAGYRAASDRLFPDPNADFLGLDRDPTETRAALARIKDKWRPLDAIKLLEAIPSIGFGEIREEAYKLLSDLAGQSFGSDHHKWYEWIWNALPGPPDDYADFKSAYYDKLDPSLGEYFRGRPPSSIRLDEVRWGGVRRDGIPPLLNPKHLTADEAKYLEPDNLVFGVEVRGEARAYPRRIMVHHEMVIDVLGGEPITAPYCGLCNAMAVYKSSAAGRVHGFGTSGFLYRSNKLMYDIATKSLWSTFLGTPAVGSLTTERIRLEPLPVVSTTWAEWRRRNPRTTVLSLDTGFRLDDLGEPRDYSEAGSYGPYFKDERPMFEVPRFDSRLKPKDDVFILRPYDETAPPIAIAARLLSNRPILHLDDARPRTVVLTDAGGANRAYQASDRVFRLDTKLDRLLDQDGRAWSISEAHLESDQATRLPRLPAHRAFWFGWYAARPETRLIQ